MAWENGFQKKNKYINTEKKNTATEASIAHKTELMHRMRYLRFVLILNATTTNGGFELEL